MISKEANEVFESDQRRKIADGRLTQAQSDTLRKCRDVVGLLADLEMEKLLSRFSTDLLCEVLSLEAVKYQAECMANNNVKRN